MSRILVVDDDPAILKAICRILRRDGHDVTGTHTGEEALAAADTTRFEVVITDYQMPTMDGLEVLHRIRDLLPGCLRILASGRLDLPAVVTAVNEGSVAHVLEKPIDHQALRSALDNASSTHERYKQTVLAGREQEDRDRGEMLEQCLRDDLLQLAVQPIVTAVGHQTIAYEALLRSRHDVLTSPPAVIEAAEKAMRIPALTSRVIDCALGRLPELASSLKLFINMHPSDFESPDRLERTVAPLLPCKERVVFEITERSSVRDFKAWRASLALLKDRGFAVALDDLGAGYSSLSALAEIKPAFIKIDMSLIRDVHKDTHKERVIELVCHLGKATAATVVAEGVENQHEADALQALGVDLLQGYYFGRPTLEAIASPSAPDNT